MIVIENLNVKSEERARQVAAGFRDFIINFAIPLLFLIIIVGLAVFVITPVYKSLPDLAGQLESKTVEAVSLQAKVAQLEDLETNRGLVTEDLTKLSWALEERDKVPELSEQVRRMSTDAKVIFNSLSYTNKAEDLPAVPVAEASTEGQPISPAPDPALYREEDVDVKIETADLQKLVDFLQVSENSIRLKKVGKIASSFNDTSYETSLLMASPYLNPGFSVYTQTSASIDLKDTKYRDFMGRLDEFTNYAQAIDATLPKL